MLDIQSGQSTLLYEDPLLSEPTWISESEFLLIRGADKDRTALVLADATTPGSRSVWPASAAKKGGDDACR